jgi:hypothetical protein
VTALNGSSVGLNPFWVKVNFNIEECCMKLWGGSSIQIVVVLTNGGRLREYRRREVSFHCEFFSLFQIQLSLRLEKRDTKLSSR